MTPSKPVASGENAVTSRERYSYALGDTGFNFVWATIELYLLFYYVNIAGLSPGTAGAVFLAGAALDLCADPLIGVLIDRHAKRFSARFWVVAATPALGVALLFTFIPRGNDALPAIILTHLLLRLTYSLGNIPYAALTARLTSDPIAQLRLTATRMQGAAIGGLIAAAIFISLPLSYSWAGIPVGALCLAVLSQPFLLISMARVRERVLPPSSPADESGRSVPGTIGWLLRDAQVLRLLLLIFVGGLAITTLHKSLLFQFAALEDLETGYLLTLGPPLSLLLTAPVWSALAGRAGMKAALFVSALMFFAGLVAADLEGFVEALVAIGLMVSIIAGAGLSVLFWSLVPQTISRIEPEAGTALASSLFGAANLSRKLAQAVAPQLIALSLLSDAVNIVRTEMLIGLVLIAIVFAWRSSNARAVPATD
ncbi:MFS transporter [Erythrobacter sp.]|uniref:MFS transporter n=1 Tax=Erythrobacter sp. TaxID=1042 RepID=UPI003C765CA4